MSDERRQHQRVPLYFDVVWEGLSGRHQARTSDLGMGGCFIDTTAQVTVGEMVTFKLILPAGGWIELQGQIAYEFPNTGFGLRFTSAADSDLKRLEWLVKAGAYKSKS